MKTGEKKWTIRLVFRKRAGAQLRAIAIRRRMPRRFELRRVVATLADKMLLKDARVALFCLDLSIESHGIRLFQASLSVLHLSALPVVFRVPGREETIGRLLEGKIVIRLAPSKMSDCLWMAGNAPAALETEGHGLELAVELQGVMLYEPQQKRTQKVAPPAKSRRVLSREPVPVGKRLSR